MIRIEWMGKEYRNAHDYYREVVMTMPREKGIILGPEEHLEALSHLNRSGIYIVDRDDKDIYVADWKVNGENLTHKHPEFGLLETDWTQGLVEGFVLPTGVCDICGKKIPGEIEMMYYFYRLDG